MLRGFEENHIKPQTVRKTCAAWFQITYLPSISLVKRYANPVLKLIHHCNPLSFKIFSFVKGCTPLDSKMANKMTQNKCYINVQTTKQITDIYQKYTTTYIDYDIKTDLWSNNFL